MICDLLRQNFKGCHRSLTVLGVAGLVALVTGCSSKPYPDLYEPGDIPAWRTVETDETLRGPVQVAAEGPEVLLETTEGPITIALYEEQAPISTANFLQYVEEGFYDGTIFHRVIPSFMIQGGGFTPDMERKETRGPIENEAENGLRNTRGTVAMARTNEIDSATSQFFINLVDNAFLNGDGVVDGYAVFGRVIEGMDVVDRIAASETGTVGEMSDVPVDPIIITSATVVEE